MDYLKRKCASIFYLDERKTDFDAEVRAGITTFLTSSYILLVNPQVLSAAGVPKTDAVIATALSSGVGSIILGYMGNMPFATVPGLGLSAYLGYGLVAHGTAPVVAFTACFLAGLLTVVLSVAGVTNKIADIVPNSVKIGTIIGMGLLIAFIGMQSVSLVVADQQSLVTLGSLESTDVRLCFAGLLLTGSLVYHKIQGSILIGICVIAIAAWWIEGDFPSSLIWVPTLEQPMSKHVSFEALSDPTCWQVTISFLFVAIFDISGVLFGMSSLAGLTRSDGSIPGSVQSFIGSGIGTMIGAALGSTPTIVCVECAAGIKDGGRTGLAACVTGALFLASIFFAPLFAMVPHAATSPVLVLVGAMMISEAKRIEWEDMSQSIPAFLTLSMMPFSYSITNGIMFGLVAAAAFSVTTGQAFTVCASARLGDVLPGGGDYEEVAGGQGRQGRVNKKRSMSTSSEISLERASSFIGD
jgi:AGZA family xanthine/uracil permease-like MFS transporter